MTKLPTKFPAKGWRRVRLNNIIRETDVWDEDGTIIQAGLDKDDYCVGEEYSGTTPLYRKIKTKKEKKK